MNGIFPFLCLWNCVWNKLIHSIHSVIQFECLTQTAQTLLQNFTVSRLSTGHSSVHRLVISLSHTHYDHHITKFPISTSAVKTCCSRSAGRTTPECRRLECKKKCKKPSCNKCAHLVTRRCSVTGSSLPGSKNQFAERTFPLLACSYILQEETFLLCGGEGGEKKKQKDAWPCHCFVCAMGVCLCVHAWVHAW